MRVDSLHAHVLLSRLLVMKYYCNDNKEDKTVKMHKKVLIPKMRLRIARPSLP